MGKATISIPLITLRETPEGTYRPRYIPGARHRKLGLKGEDLRHPDGSWFTLDECARWSAERLALVAQLEDQPKKQRRETLAQVRGRITVGALFEKWFAEPHMRGEIRVEGRKRRLPLAANTVRHYRNAANQLQVLDDGTIWNSPAAAITASIVGNPKKGILHRIEVKHGLATARSVRAALSACYGWGEGAGLVGHNPVNRHAKLPMPAPRIRVGSIAEMKALIAAADRIGRHEVGDAIMLGLFTGQRQADRLALEDGRITKDGILFRQGKKHGQPLLIPQAPELAARLNAARIRRAEWRVNYPHVILDEVPRRPFEADWYRKVFREVREAAVAGAPADGIEPAKTLADFRDQDLRDTAVTWLALAGCSKIEIASITGHSLKSIDEILKHYLGLHPDLARSAIGKLVAWHEAQQGEGE